MKRILVIRGGAIGDFVLTLPAIKLLREAYPNAHLEILGYRHIVALAEARFYAAATRSLESGALARFFARGAELPNEWCDYFASFDLVVSYLFDPDQIFQRNLDLAGVELFLACSPRISDDESAAKQLARPLEQLDLFLSEAAARVFPSPDDREFAQEFLREQTGPIVALHPGSGSARKNWPIERWIELADWLLREGRAGSLLALGGEADGNESAALTGAARPGSIQRVENLPLPYLAAVLEQCQLFVGHDSGISHLAAAAGTPSVLLFGPTDPEIWAPANEQVRVVKSPNERMESLPLAAVQKAIAASFTN